MYILSRRTDHYLSSHLLLLRWKLPNVINLLYSSFKLLCLRVDSVLDTYNRQFPGQILWALQDIQCIQIKPFSNSWASEQTLGS